MPGKGAIGIRPQASIIMCKIWNWRGGTFIWCVYTYIQGWEFAHLISERIARFCPKMSEWAIGSKKWAIHSFAHLWWGTWAIRSQSLISSEQPERIAHGCSILVSNLSDLLTSLIWFMQNERFIHIAHQKRGNKRK